MRGKHICDNNRDKPSHVHRSYCPERPSAFCPMPAMGEPHRLCACAPEVGGQSIDPSLSDGRYLAAVRCGDRLLSGPPQTNVWWRLRTGGSGGGGGGEGGEGVFSGSEV